MIAEPQAPPGGPLPVASFVQSGSVDDARQLAWLYDSLEFSMIPIRPGTKQPSVNWRQYQTKHASIVDVFGWIDAGNGLGVVLGQVSNGWVCRDFDDIRAYEMWATAYPQLAESLPTSRTNRGRHVFVRLAEQTKTSKFIDGELRAEGAYVLVPPTPYPTGDGEYEWIIPLHQMDTGMRLSNTGLDRTWLDGTQRTKKTRTTHGTESSACEAVRTLTPDQIVAIEDAIRRTVPAGIGGRNDGIFRYARRVVAILNGKPDSSLTERLAMKWFEVAQSSIGTLDVGVTIADFQHAIASVRKPDYGTNAVDKAWELAQAIAPPWFVKSIAERQPDSVVVSLAKLVVALDVKADGGPWLLPCRDPERLIGQAYSHTQVNRQLALWVKQGIIKLVENGRPGTHSRMANKYQLLHPESQNAGRSTAQEDQ
jgi:hypothetical protein